MSVEDKLKDISLLIPELQKEKNITQSLKLKKKINTKIKNAYETLNKLKDSVNFKENDTDINSESTSDNESSNSISSSGSDNSNNINIDELYLSIEKNMEKIKNDNILIEDKIKLFNKVDEKINNLINILKKKKIVVEEI